MFKLLLLSTLFIIESFVCNARNYNIATTSIKKDKPIKEEINSIIDSAELYKNYNPQKGLEFIERAYSMAIKSNDSISLLEISICKAEILYFLTDYFKAISLLDSTKAKAKEYNQKELVTEILNLKGIIYWELNWYDKSSECIFTCKRSVNELKNTKLKSSIYNSLGLLYLLGTEREKAKEFFLTAFKIDEDEADRESVAIDFAYLGLYYLEVNKLDSAFINCENANSIFKNSNNKRGEGFSDLIMGKIYFEKNEFEKSKQYLNIGLKIFSESKFAFFEAQSYLELARLYFKNDSLEISYNYAQKAYDSAEKLKVSNIKYNALLILENYYMIKGDSQNIYISKLEKYNARDTLRIIKDKVSIQRLELTNEWEKSKYERSLNNKRIIKIFYILFIIGLSILLLFLFFTLKKTLEIKKENKEKFNVINNYNKRKKDETFLKNRGNTRVALLKEVMDEIIDIQANLNNGNIEFKLNKVLKEINAVIEDEDFNEFKIHFRDISNEFYVNLLQKFPDLTSNEQKLCAYIKLNMSTKEISDLSGQTQSTIEVARYRLRKKLGLNNTEIDLGDYIAEF